jgi:hypothetical protein
MIISEERCRIFGAAPPADASGKYQGPDPTGRHF